MKRWSILIAEDEPKLLRNLSAKIQSAHHQFEVCATALNGKDALELARKYKPDVLFTDIRMPEMDGLSLIAELRKIFSDLDCVILTGYADFSYAQQALRCQVTEYLLKPVEMDSLTETLNKIAARRSLLPMLNNYESIASMVATGSLDSQLYQSCFVCMGNLWSSFCSHCEYRAMQENWNQISWEALFSSALPPDTDWKVAAGEHPNEYYVFVQAPFVWQPFLKQFETVLHQAFPLQAAHFCCGEETAPLTEIFAISQRQRQNLEQELILNTPQTLVSHLVQPRADTLLSVSVQKNLHQLAFSPEKDALKNYLDTLLKRWDAKKYPQRSIENAITHLLRQLYLESLPNSDREIEQIIAELQAQFFSAKSAFSLSPYLLTLFSLTSPSKDSTDSQRCAVAQQLVSYIEKHYEQDLTLEYLSSEFNYSVSYLLRIFKEHTNQTLIHYLTHLRIHKAQELIASSPTLSFRTISEMVGYRDQHYFSRAFKNAVGCSPKEYRQSLI